ncbi:hypothetical protein ABKV19_018017 [Rosa sericea]
MDLVYWCRELLCKPIVLSCGHISCFWCVHRSMSGEKQSHCPLCRHPYNHFPTICQLLHCLLLKLYPVAYKKRELQILEQEEETGYFSPQLDVQAWSSQANQDSNILGDSVSKELSANMEKTVFNSYNQNNGIAVSRPTDGGDYEGMENVTEQVKNPLLCQQQSGSPKQISVADVLCAACKELLFRPVVLNCGHVYCESCIVKQNEQKLRCQVCQSFHPTGYPKVCLDLQNFLIEQFPKELAHRRDGVQRKHVNPTTCESKSSKEAEKSSSGSYHIGVGCDYCGMYPIIGDRYRCKDCVEKIGFDLCNDCYNTSSKLPGRFNQQHTAEHQFELISGNIIRDQLRIMSERLGDGSFAVLLAHMSGIPEEDAGNRELPHATSTNGESDEDAQDGSQPSFQHGGI